MSMNPRGNGPTSVSGLKTPPPGNRVGIFNGNVQDPLSPRNKGRWSHAPCSHTRTHTRRRFSD